MGRLGLRDFMVGRQDLFIENFTERLLTYALGGGAEEYDRPLIRKIVRESASDDHRWSSIILSIVKSKPFQMIQARGAQAMVITGKSIDRRTFLYGTGAAFALPLLDAMTPAFATGAARPTRLGFFRFD